jgi:hypothetical protein
MIRDEKVPGYQITGFIAHEIFNPSFLKEHLDLLP